MAFCRFVLKPEGGVILHRCRHDETYEEALLALGINPDTVLVMKGRRSLPIDEKIEEEEVEILLTCSRG
ncbi:MAG: thiamine S protein [Methanomicrobiales archaeon]|nr:thiamine S protein [Methanomicrobiales archaeon]